MGAPTVRVLLAQGDTVALWGQIESREQPNLITLLVNGQQQTTLDMVSQGLRTLDAVQLTLQWGTHTAQFVCANKRPLKRMGVCWQSMLLTYRSLLANKT